MALLSKRVLERYPPLFPARLGRGGLKESGKLWGKNYFPKTLLVLASFAILALPVLHAQKVSEKELKAAFLFNFTQFVEWPTNAFTSPASPIIIGILGNDPFGTILDNIIEGEHVRNRPLRVQRYRQMEPIPNCHVLYICDSEQNRIDSILWQLRGRPILTVSELNDFSRRGGMIQLITATKVRFWINQQAAEEAGLSMSSKLLRLADKVIRSEGGP